MADDIIAKLGTETDPCWGCQEWNCGETCECHCHDWPDIHAEAQAHIESLRAAGDALAKTYRGLCVAHGYLMYEQIDSMLQAWEEARRGYA